MAEISVLDVLSRPEVGKGAARATRRGGKVPAVVYGADKGSQPISLDPQQLEAELHKPGFFARLFDLDVEGKKQRVLCRDIQFDPVRDVPLHVDFLRVSAATRIDVEVPVVFANEEECLGLKRGGVLNIVRHTVELNCRADSIPPEIMLDLADKDIGHSFHISGVDLPEGVTPTITDRDFTIVTIAAPTVAPAEEEEAAAEEGVEAIEGEAPPEAAPVEEESSSKES